MIGAGRVLARCFRRIGIGRHVTMQVMVCVFGCVGIWVCLCIHQPRRSRIPCVTQRQAGSRNPLQGQGKHHKAKHKDTQDMHETNVSKPGRAWPRPLVKTRAGGVASELAHT